MDKKIKVNSKVKFRDMRSNKSYSGVVKRIVKVIDDYNKSQVDKILYFVNYEEGCHMAILESSELEKV